MGKPKKAKTRRFYIGIGSKICLRSAHIWPKELAPRGALLLWQKIVAPLGPMKSFCKIQFSLQNPFVRSDFPRSKFDFLQWLSHFHEIRENLFQRLSDFFNGFPLSETAFRFLQRLSDFLQRLSIFWQIRENLSMAANIRKIAIRALYFLLKIAIFRDKIVGGWNTNNQYSSFVFSASSFVILAN